jgi:hypothetical protein
MCPCWALRLPRRFQRQNPAARDASPLVPQNQRSEVVPDRRFNTGGLLPGLPPFCISFLSPHHMSHATGSVPFLHSTPQRSSCFYLCRLLLHFLCCLRFAASLLETYTGTAAADLQRRIDWNPDDPNLLQLTLPGGLQARAACGCLRGSKGSRRSSATVMHTTAAAAAALGPPANACCCATLGAVCSSLSAADLL